MTKHADSIYHRSGLPPSRFFPILVATALLASGCGDSAAELEQARMQGFCMSYIRGLAGVALGRDDSEILEDVDRSYLKLIRSAHVNESNAERWWRGYYDGDVHFRDKLGDQSTDKSSITDSQVAAAFDDFSAICKEQLEKTDQGN